jgi:hypothetical protein
MENTRLRERAPTAVNVTVGKGSRDYLTEREVERLIEAAKQNRSGHRDATTILVAHILSAAPRHSIVGAAYPLRSVAGTCAKPETTPAPASI